MKKTFGLVARKASIGNDKWIELAKNGMLVALVAGLTYLVDHQSQLELGQWTPIVVALSTVALSYLKKVVDNPATPKPVVPDPVQPPKPDDGTVNFPL